MEIIFLSPAGEREEFVDGNLTRGLLRCTPGYYYVTPTGFDEERGLRARIFSAWSALTERRVWARGLQRMLTQGPTPTPLRRRGIQAVSLDPLPGWGEREMIQLVLGTR